LILQTSRVAYQNPITARSNVVIGILQPGYIPWLGFFEQLYKSDIFVIYDDVQYDKGSWRNRNRIKTANGIQWLTVPVLLDFDEHVKVNKVRIDNNCNWRKKHFFSIKQNYSKSPFFNKYSPIFEEAFTRSWEFLIDLDMFFIHRICEIIGISRKIEFSSSLNISGNRIDRLVNICKYYNADVFYEGAAGRDYIDSDMFLGHGITVQFQDYKHPVYNQLYGKFSPYLSIIDLLFNHGDASLEIIISQERKGRQI
jgi:hypothetical protein